jgi:pseudaminic acid biosynthesis-associated methylase
MTDRLFKTEQEEFWAGAFGNEYNIRNRGNQLIASNISVFSRALRRAEKPASCIEFGANIGLNLRALKLLYPEQEQYAVEINPEAAATLRSTAPWVRVFESSILDFENCRIRGGGKCDLAFTKGVLIHINPDLLTVVYEKLYEATSRYLLVCEYYNPKPVSVPYRGHSDRLFKRDFGGELMDMHPNLALLDYGFVYHRDTTFPQDDMTWFLMQKK